MIAYMGYIYIHMQRVVQEKCDVARKKWMELGDIIGSREIEWDIVR